MNTIEKQAEEFVTTKYNGWISTIENMKIAYLAGASAMNGSAGVQWVKASDRLPVDSDLYVCKIVRKKDGATSERVAYVDYRTAYKKFFIGLEDFEEVKLWLDESVSSPSPQIKCDQCGGNGYIAEHHTDCDGSPDFCGSICPVKYECVKCNGTGFLAASPSPLEAETADKNVNNQIMKYRKLPVVIDAVKWNGKNFDEISDFTGDRYGHKVAYEDAEEVAIKTGVISIRTLEGDMKASKGDWIIKGVNGEFYPCKPDIFEKTYEPVQ